MSGPDAPSSSDARSFDAVLDAALLTRFQISIAVLCGTVAMVDGFAGLASLVAAAAVVAVVRFGPGARSPQG